MEQHRGNGDGGTGWVTTRVAAAALGVKPRQVRNYISEGLLEATAEGEGVHRRYLVSIASVEALRAERYSEGKMPGQDRDVTDAAEDSGHALGDAAELVRELASELGEVRYRLGRAEARLELTAQAESTLREQLVRERERADRAERRLLELETRATTPPGPRDGRETPAEAPGGVEGQDGDGGAPEGVQRRRSWWRTWFGFE